jgi:hypothetical protein
MQYMNLRLTLLYPSSVFCYRPFDSVDSMNLCKYKNGSVALYFSSIEVRRRMVSVQQAVSIIVTAVSVYPGVRHWHCC